MFVWNFSRIKVCTAIADVRASNPASPEEKLTPVSSKSLSIPWHPLGSVDHHRSLPFVRASSAVIVPSLLSSDILEVTMDLARMAFVFGSDCSELQRRRSLRLFYSNSLTETSTLVRPVFNSVNTELRCKRPPSLLYNDSSAKFSTLAMPDYVIVLFVPTDL